MRKIVTAIVFLFMFSGVSHAQFNIGAGVTYLTEGSEIGLQAKGIIGVQEKWRFSPAINYYLTKGSSFGFDADVHYELFTISDNVNIFPVGGINWTRYGEDLSDIGINLGVFSDFTVKDGSLHFYIEPKLLFVGDASGFVISAGILFR